MKLCIIFIFVIFSLSLFLESTCASNTCGDNICDPNIGENCVTCQADCGTGPCGQCGDGFCETAKEDCSSCSKDCHPCVDECALNNGGCDRLVNCSISQDNKIVCGDCPVGTVGSGYTVCASASCGDGFCNATIENCVSCKEDCGTTSCGECGDGVCDAHENCTNCFTDCSSYCTPPACGDAFCNVTAGENCVTCQSDCGKGPCGICGDGFCETAKEDCSSCSKDCRPCVDECALNNGGCDPLVNCSISQDNKVVCGDCPVGTVGSGYTGCASASCGDGFCNSTIENCVSCKEDCGTTSCGVCGDGVCDAHENCNNCFLDCSSYCTPQPSCGDAICNVTAGENCVSCQVDCGKGPCGLCGDGVCDNEENCTSCRYDCGPCATVSPPTVIVNVTTGNSTEEDDQSSASSKVTLCLFSYFVAIVSFILL